MGSARFTFSGCTARVRQVLPQGLPARRQNFRLLWNNPKVHAPERRKIWLACSEHVGWLENYLREREFWKQTLPFKG